MKKKLLMILAGLTAVCGMGYGVYVSRSPVSQTPAQTALIAIPAQVEVNGASGNSVQSEFKLLNSGALPVAIDRIETSCHCTTIESLDKNKLAPAESAVVRLKLNPPAKGNQSAVVTVYVSEPSPLEIRVPIHMKGQEILPPFISSMPSSIRREFDVTGEVPVEFEFLTVEHPGGPWVTGMSSSTNDILGAELTPRIEHEFQDYSGNASSVMRIYTCRLKMKPLSPGHSIRGFLRPQCSTESQKPIPTVPVMIDYPFTIKAIPSEIFVAADEAMSTVIERKVILESREEGLLSSLQVSSSTDRMSTEVTETSSTTTELKVRIAPPINELEVDSVQLTVRFRDNKLSAIVIPIVIEQN